VKQVRVVRRPRRSAGGGEPASEALPTQPAIDTSRAGQVLGRIDELLRDR
jgi:hypothetical protein